MQVFGCAPATVLGIQDAHSDHSCRDLVRPQNLPVVVTTVRQSSVPWHDAAAGGLPLRFVPLRAFRPHLAVPLHRGDTVPLLARPELYQQDGGEAAITSAD